MSQAVQNNMLVFAKRYKLDKQRFCDLFGISLKKYDNYVKGNYNYSLEDMALLQANYQLLETERIKEEDKFKVTAETYE